MTNDQVDVGSTPRGGHPQQVKGSVARAFYIAQMLTSARTPLGVSEIARRTSLPKSTTARTLSTLVEAGVVERADHQYLPAQRLLDRFEHDNFIRRILIPILLHLHDRTGLNTGYGILRYGRVYFEEALYDHRMADVLSDLPRWAPAEATSTGKALLAYSSIPHERSVPADPQTANYIDLGKLKTELAQIRRTGLAQSDGSYVDSVSSLAVPVFGAANRLVGAIAVCGAPGSFDAREGGVALRAAAQAANLALRSAVRH